MTSESEVCMKTYPNDALVRARCLHGVFDQTVQKMEEEEREIMRKINKSGR